MATKPIRSPFDTAQPGRSVPRAASADAVLMSSAPEDHGAEVGGPRLGPLGWLRWLWRTLTSMRTALVLLLLLALAAIPGSVIPQQGRQPVDTADFRRRHPSLAPVLDKLGFFGVFSSPWFAAVYLLLFVSLAGCILPRSRQYVRTLRGGPPAAPRVLHRLPHHQGWDAAGDPAQVLAAARTSLRRRRFRVIVDPDGGSVAAEKGYLREAGNLVFHVALFGLLVALAVGSLFGVTGQKIVLEGDGFTNTATQYDDLAPGKLAGDSLEPFGFRLLGFSASYQRSGPQRGTASSFVARLSVTGSTGDRPREVRVEVNHPLSVGGSKVFLVGHGYAPVVTVRDAKGNIAWSGPVPFLPQDGNLRSVGVVKAPDAVDAAGRSDQLGFSGLFLPTVQLTSQGWLSTFPAADKPVMVLTAYHGDLGLGSGMPQSIYRLDTRRMTQFRDTGGSPYARALRPGEVMRLPGGAGSLSFDGIRQWASFQIARNPSNGTALWSAVAMGLGLTASLFVRRRRVWVRAVALPGGGCRIEVAGVDRTGTDRMAEETADLAARLRETFPARPPSPAGDSPQHASQEER